MSRHALHPTRTRSRRHPVRIALAALLTLAVVGAVMVRLDATPSAIRALAANAPVVGAECPSTRLPVTTVTLTVAPELHSTIEQALKPLLTKTLPERECVRYTVQAQEPSDTVQSAAILPLDRAPDIWLPDSSLWESRVPRWQVNQDGSFATTPVVIATSQRAIDTLGWDKQNPTWVAALAGTRPLAVPRIAEDAAGLSAVIALWQTLGKTENAQKALAGTVLASGRVEVPSEAQAIAAAESDSAAAPLLPTSQQAVTAANAGKTKPSLVAVSPTGGQPVLDYPVLTMLRPAVAGSEEQAATRERAVRAVVSQLLSSQSAQIAKTAGFQVAEGQQPAAPSTGATPSADASSPQPVSSPSPIVGLAPAELAALVERITLLSAPSRILVIFDLSKSMQQPAGNGQNRIAFAATAATLAGNLMTDRAQVGLWGFSRDLRGKDDIIKIEDVTELGVKVDGVKHRDAINNGMSTAYKYLGGNGTALYSTAVAGLREMNSLYDPRAGNAVVIFTDGANYDKGGPTLKATLKELGELYDPKKPVRIMAIGIGDGITKKALAAMQAMAGKTNGQAYLAEDPKQLPGVLFEAMNKRSE